VSSGARDWKKSEKALYLPAVEPCRIDVPAFSFFAIRGRGNPNGAAFQDYISVLYSLAYAVRMSYKWDEPPAGYETYAVYPLEGVWDVSDEVKAAGPGVRGPLDKDSLVFNLMIRQPEFVTPDLAARAMETVRRRSRRRCSARPSSSRWKKARACRCCTGEATTTSPPVSAAWRRSARPKG